MSKTRVIAAAAAALTATPALAHHPLAGAPMETFAQGVLSGVGHPILGFDHLAFVAIVGVAAMFTGRALLAPLGYVGGMLAGCLLAMAGLTMPLAEAAIAVSLLAMGAVVLSGRAMQLPAAMVAFGAFGLFHGAAFAGSILGQEAGYGAAVAVGYLLGLASVQYALALGFGFAVAKVMKATEAQAVEARIAGALVAGIGVFLTLETAEGAVFAALGLG